MDNFENPIDLNDTESKPKVIKSRKWEVATQLHKTTKISAWHRLLMAEIPEGADERMKAAKTKNKRAA